MDDLPIEDLHKQSTQIARNVPKACNNLHDEKDKTQYARRSRTTSNHLADAKAELADVRQNEST